MIFAANIKANTYTDHNFKITLEKIIPWSNFLQSCLNILRLTFKVPV